MRGDILNSPGFGYILILPIVLFFSLFKGSRVQLDELLIRRFMSGFFLEKRHIDKSVRFFWTALVITALLALALSIFPPLVPHVAETLVSPGTRSYILSNKSEIKAWLDFVTIILELAIALCIGGAVFSETLANRLKQRLYDWQTTYAQEGKEVAEESISETVGLSNRVKRIYNDVRQFNFDANSFTEMFVLFSEKLEEADRTAENLRKLLFHDYPTVVQKLVMGNLIRNFPGGIYGMMAFLLFFCLMVMKVTAIYVSNLL